MSQRHSGYAPVPRDEYHTPYWVTAALLEVEKLPTRVWEPAPGEEHMVRVLKTTGLDVIATRFDFLGHGGALRRRCAIVTNPPYSNGMADKFVRHALELTRPGEGKVAMLLPAGFDAAQGRLDLFGRHPAFQAKYTLLRRIRWENLEQKKNGPSGNHAWFVWDWQNRGAPFCGYLP